MSTSHNDPSGDQELRYEGGGNMHLHIFAETPFMYNVALCVCVYCNILLNTLRFCNVSMDLVRRSKNRKNGDNEKVVKNAKQNCNVEQTTYLQILYKR